MTTYKAVAAMLTGVLMMSPLAGCAGQQQPTQEEETKKSENTDTKQGPVEPVVGGWAMNQDAASSLTDEQQETFAKASAGYEVTLEPVAMLATQVVAGSNEAYLCKQAATDGAAEQWVVAVVYNDLEGNSSITSVKALDYDKLVTGDEQAYAEDMVGAWEIQPQEGVALPGDAQGVFDEFVKAYLGGADIKPVALLGTQVVSGTNYLVLCETADKAMIPAENNTLLVVKAYQDLDGNVQLGDILTFNLLEYV